MPLNERQREYALLARNNGESEYKIAKFLGVKRHMVAGFFVEQDCSHLVHEPRPIITDKERSNWEVWKRSSPRDLTAALMGDPLPGFSALERR